MRNQRKFIHLKYIRYMVQIKTDFEARQAHFLGTAIVLFIYMCKISP